jgi:hypothetical protein
MKIRNGLLMENLLGFAFAQSVELITIGSVHDDCFGMQKEKKILYSEERAARGYVCIIFLKRGVKRASIHDSTFGCWVGSSSREAARPKKGTGRAWTA